MILAVDVGNTQTVLGLVVDGSLGAHWRISTDATLTPDEIRVKVGALLAADGHSWGDVDRLIISSVVPRLTDAYEEIAREATGKPAMVVGPGLKTGLPIRYDNPHEVGADRVVNAVAAKMTYGAPVIIVDFGTATTMDVVDDEGAYLGGAIAPGLVTSAQALIDAAARLSQVDIEDPGTVIGRTTRASIQAGLLLGQAAMVDGLVRRAFDELGTACPVVATGGLAERMAPLCETVTDVAPDLTLDGLIAIHAMNV